MHSSFLLALPLAHLGTARYLPWGNSRTTLARREFPAIQVVPMADPGHESMSMSMSGAHPMASVIPMVKLAASSSVASAVLISMAPASATAAPKASVSASIASIAAPSASASAAAPFVPKAPSASVGSIAIPTASAASSAVALSSKASSASSAAVSAKATSASSSAVAPKSSSSSSSAPTVAPALPSAAPAAPAGPSNPAVEAGISSGLQLNILTLEAELAASTDLLEQAQKGNPLNKQVYNIGKENLKALQVAGVRIRVNNMELAKNNPKVLRSLAALQAEQAREAELSSKLTGDATGDLSVLMQLQRMLAAGVQKQSNFKVDELSGADDPQAQPQVASDPSPFNNIQPVPAIVGAPVIPALPTLSSSSIALPVPALATPVPAAAGFGQDAENFEGGDPMPKAAGPKETKKASPTQLV